MNEHRWGDEASDRVRACLSIGCTVRRRLVGVSLEQWQAAPRHHWHVIPKAGAHCAVPIPPCTGKQFEADRCSHVERPSGAKCHRNALPRLVVCEQHATPDALRMVILAMDAEIQRLKQLPDALPDNTSEPAA